MPDLEQTAIERLKAASEMSLALFREPLIITYSGGKDSDVMLHLAEVSGIPFEVLHSLTTADAPETVHHVYNAFRRLEGKGIKCTVDKHTKPDGSRVTMWNLIPRKLTPPTRVVRYCCSELKEGGGKGRFIATGVRWAESAARKKNRGGLEVIASSKKNSLILSNDNDEDRRLFETCQLKGKRVVNPIIDWKDADVLDYAAAEKIVMNPLYCEGFGRVGCVGCPMAGKGRVFEFARYPKIKAAYIRAFDRMLEELRRRNQGAVSGTWNTGVDVFHWWLEDGVLPGQEVLDGFEEVTG
jgi:3'-phosphoadenosine 5'-phosphosulfate sulfotransferase (PAPS reductase)/FAD synthetase